MKELKQKLEFTLPRLVGRRFLFEMMIPVESIRNFFCLGSLRGQLDLIHEIVFSFSVNGMRNEQVEKVKVT